MIQSKGPAGVHASHTTRHEPGKPTVTWFTAACLLVSNIIGGGVFTTTGFMARELGDPIAILALWLIGGLIALAGALCYAELGAALPRAGGDYVYLREAYGPIFGFLSGWTSLTIGFGAAVAASSVGFASYALRTIHADGDTGWIGQGIALALLWSMTAVHASGLGAGGRLQRSLTSATVFAILVFVVGGLMGGAGQWTHLSEPAPHASMRPGGLLVALIFVLYCYLGWNVAGYIAAEIDDPPRTIPSILIAGTTTVLGCYLLLNLVYLYALPVTALAQEPVLPVAEKVAAALWGPASARWAAGLICMAIAGGVSAMVWAGPRIYWAMAKDGLFLPWTAAVHPSSGIPVRALVLQSAWASILILTGTYEQIVVYSGFVLVGFTALTVGALFVLRRKAPSLARPYRVPFYPWLPGLLMTGAAGLVGYGLIVRPMESLLGLGTVLAGLPLYWLWQKQR